MSQTLNEVKLLWPECTDLLENDIIEMYKEIDIVNQDEFTNGKKYSIETISLQENVENMIKNMKIKSFEQIHQINDLKQKENKIINVKANGKSENDFDDDEYNFYNNFEDSEYEESDYFDDYDKQNKDDSKRENKLTKNKKINKTKNKKYKIIVPFDYDHKGILEPNKDFSGFIQQFIAIKEMFKDEENSNMLIKDISIYSL